MAPLGLGIRFGCPAFTRKEPEMPTRRGTTNRLTGKTTPRTKGKTHWGGGMKRAKKSAKAGKTAKAGASGAAKKA
jgi:hypothetical protein